MKFKHHISDRESKTFVCCAFPPMLLAALICPVEAQAEHLPLRGLDNQPDQVQGQIPNLNPNQIQVYPQLDKSLLITPGLKPLPDMEALSSIAATKITTSVDSTNKGRGKFCGIAITVVNNSDRAILVDGDGAKLQVGSEEKGAIALSDLAALSILPELTNKKFITDLKATSSAAFTMGWAQTIRDAHQARGPITDEKGGRYGLEEQRRNDELSRFGKRVLWPSEKTSGVLYFNPPLGKGVLTIQVCSYYKKDDKSTITLSY